MLSFGILTVPKWYAILQLMNSVEEKIRQLKVPQLEILKLLAESKNGVSSSKEISETTSTSSYLLGAMITPLRRIKVDEKNLIIPAGREADNTMRWQINEDVITCDDLKALLVSMNI